MATATTIYTAAKIWRGIKTPPGFNRSLGRPHTDGRGGWTTQTLTLEDATGIKIEIVMELPLQAGSYYLASGHVSYRGPNGKSYSFDRHGVEDSFYIDNPDKRPKNFWSGDRVVLGKRLGTLKQTAGYRDWGADRHFVDEYEVLWDDDEQVTTYSGRQFKRAKITRSDIITQTNETIRKFIEERIPESQERIARSESVPGLPFSVTPERKQQIEATLDAGKFYTFMPSGFGTGYRIAARKFASWAKPMPQLDGFFKLKGKKRIWFDTFDAD